MDSAKKIKRLDTSVVNQIAAGEIIIQPANALKEMLENSIDAQSTSIDVVAKDGGLKLLQIVDNGTGIHKEDLDLLCERFATSKLRRFSDLSLISTYGFRGEALASISHISHLSVVSKVATSSLAFKAYYLNGTPCSSKFKLDSNATPKPVAGKNGTQITVEDLFYNVPSRLRALKPKNEEWAKILEVIGRYAIHTDNVGISCKKFGEPFPAIATRLGMSLKERVRTVFGVSVSSDLIEFLFPGPQELEAESDYGLLDIRGAVTGFNYSNKRRVPPVFFINNRLVSCDPLAKTINSVFQYFLPKGTHPFIYMSLNIVPQNLDVNIHPTKREVRFLFEDEIIEWICGKVHHVLSEKDGSRTFKQSTLKRLSNATVVDEIATPSKVSRQEHKLVRVDASQLKINSFVKKDFSAAVKNSLFVDTQISSPSQNVEQVSVIGGSSEILDESQPADTSETSGITQTGRDAVELNLVSVLELREEVSESMHQALTNVFSNLVYVGLVDACKRVCCFQYDVKLFLCDYGAILAAHLYQRALFNIGNYGEFVLKKPLPLEDILKPLYQANDTLEDMEVVISRIMSMEEMFMEYFQLSFKGRSLCMLPLISLSSRPSQEKLPYFIYRLGSKVNFNNEKDCLREIMKQIALFYIPERVSEQAFGAMSKIEEINSVLEHDIFPDLRELFIASEDLLCHVIQVADLPGLYKVFERC